MTGFTRILVDIDSRAARHPALERAVVIARATGAEIVVADVMAAEELAAHLPCDEAEHVDAAAKRLDTVARAASGVVIGSKLLFGPPAAALIAEVERSGADLLVRDHARDLSATGYTPYGPVDRALVRDCPAPVLLTGPGARPEHPRVVGAVAPDDDQPAVAALNRAVVAYAMAMARIEGGSATVMRAWVPFAERLLRSHDSAGQVASYVETQRREAKAALAEIVGSQDGDAEKIATFAQRGPVDTALPAFVVDNAIDTVVIGVAPRRGLARLMRGTTAERLLRRLPCSILAVKADLTADLDTPARVRT